MQHCLRIPFIGSCVFCLLFGCSFASENPNVVIVITDDQGYGDLSCHGNPILKTPHIDDLYKTAIRLSDYHVAPTCSPTRSAFLTGHWTNRTGVWHTIMGRSMLRENEVTMGQVFQDAGYATGMFGKWHLGDNYPFRPEDRGYGEVLRHGGGGVGQTPDYWDNAYFGGSYWHNSKVEPVKGFCTDVFFDYAKKFIKAESGAGRPFLAYIATNAPHGPMHAPVSFSEPYRDLGVAGSNFFGMIANIDKNIGDLRSFLRAEGLEENTVFIFTTDNGTAAGDRVFNAGMRGKKGSEYEGGHRVPFFVYWPAGGLAGGRAVAPITAHVDVLPTLIELSGILAPPGIAFDGKSIVSLLKEGSDQEWPDRILVTDSQRVRDPIKWRKSSVMTSRWRLINGRELYDVGADPGQRDDVSKAHPAVVQRLRDFYESWWSELLPTFKNDTAIYLGHEDENPARLTSHDWITTGSTPWNQAHVRRALNGEENTGFWNVQIAEAGEYEVQLRRWPKELDIAIDAPLESGTAVPGAKAYRTARGVSIAPVKAVLQVGSKIVSKDVVRGNKAVSFRIHLDSRKTQLSARFEASDGTQYGAYYVYVYRT
jgi:arylsulfatase A-like enzyme